MKPITTFEKFMHWLGYVPKFELEEEYAHARRAAELAQQRDDEIAALETQLAIIEDKAARIHAAGIQKERELEKEIADLKRMTVVARSETDGDEYARNLFEDVFPGKTVPDRLNEVMEKLHLFMTSQATDLRTAHDKLLTMTDMANSMAEILDLLRQLPGMPPKCPQYPLLSIPASEPLPIPAFLGTI